MTALTIPLPSAATLASTVYERLREEILVAVLPPGEKLRVEPLRLRLGVGASPIREALNRLAAEGLVQQIDQRGFRVASVSAAELADLTAARCALYALTLGQAIANGDAAWEERIVVAYHRMSRALSAALAAQRPADADFDRTHHAFHRALIDACGSPTLIGICDDLFDRARRYQYLSMPPAPAPQRAVDDEHRALMDAVLRRDAPAAIALLQAHVRHTADLVQQRLDQP
jgi:GntR family carbon starvation induced transcriptional regulator